MRVQDRLGGLAQQRLSRQGTEEGQHGPAGGVPWPKPKGGELNGAGGEDAVERVEPGKSKTPRGAGRLAEQVIGHYGALHGRRVARGKPIQDCGQFRQHHRLGKMDAPGCRPEPERFCAAVPTGRCEPLRGLNWGGRVGDIGRGPHPSTLDDPRGIR